MQERVLISGFSELKDLLIKTYKLERSREYVRLYFSEKYNMLCMHDYDNHKNVIVISFDLENKFIKETITGNAYRIVKESLNYTSPAEFLNNGFKLSGFFRS